MPDHFDRLVGRAAPAAVHAGAADAGVVRVRPRLPGPFERMDAFGARVEPLGLDFEERESAEPAPRTESSVALRRPVEPAPHPTPVQPVAHHLPLALREQAAPQRGVLTPAVVPQPVPEPVARPAQRAAVEDGETSKRVADSGRQSTETTVRRESAEARPKTDQRPVAAVPAQTVRPAARPAAPAAGRRSARDDARQRPQERTVHISIGRLEVRAAGRRNDTAAGRPRERAEQSARQSPVLSLEKYLSRGEAQR